MESPTLFLLMMFTFGIVLILAIVDLIGLRRASNGESTMGQQNRASFSPLKAIDPAPA